MLTRRLATAGLGLIVAVTAGCVGTAAEPAQMVVRRVPNAGIQPEVVLDRRGTLHMIYFGGNSQSGNLFYVRSSDFGASFSTPVLVNSQEGSAIATGRSAAVKSRWDVAAASISRGTAQTLPFREAR